MKKQVDILSYFEMNVSKIITFYTFQSSKSKALE